MGRTGGRTREVQVRRFMYYNTVLSSGRCGTHWREDYRSTIKDGSGITTQSYLVEGVGRTGGRAREVQVRMVHVLQHSLI